jgi:signal transduction histidine kinase
VRVAVRQFPESLTAEIDDDGQGFAMDGQATGLGLLGIRERAAIAGGSLTIDSAPGQGTRIALRIPVAAPSSQSRAEVTA